MELRLKYKPEVTDTAAAVFIEGNNAAVWLSEMQRWGVLPSQLQCYVAARSVNTIEAGGLFVVINGPNRGVKHTQFAYRKVGSKLYVPANAELYPAVTAEELDKLLLWPVQFFHPVNGITGFEQTDRIDLAGLIKKPAGSNFKWSAPPTASKTPVLLRSIRVQALPMADVIEAMKEDIGQKPLDELPQKHTSAVRTVRFILFNLLLGLLQLLLFIPAFILSALGALFFGNEPPASSTNREPTWFDKLISRKVSELVNFIQKTKADLQRERDSEINRLMNLFEDDPNEALKYAIPLASIYENRGVDTGGGFLQRSDALFNLRGLGGGKVVSTWNVGDRYNDLRQKYLLAAEEALRRGNFKRAAYVYAHLLGDYRSAANALKKGKLYREAAALYLEHLKDKRAAAECFEEGGLIAEAIEIYLELNQYEKVGDLYTLVGKHERANENYNEACAVLLKANDYLEAARIRVEKLKQPDAAMQTLKSGWENLNSPAACLKQYYTLLKQHHPDTALYDLKQVYSSIVIDRHRELFLETLPEIRGILGTEADAVTTDMAYEIISRFAAQKNYSHLNHLARYTNADPMVKPDVTRYVNLQKKQSALVNVLNEVQLNKDIKWFKAYNLHHCFYALGIMNGRLVFSRNNWYNNTDYCVWKDPFKEPPQAAPFIVAANALQQGMVIIHAPGETYLYDKKLAANKYFNFKLDVLTLPWMPQGVKGLGVNNAGSITMLVRDDSSFYGLYTYDTSGNLLKRIDCTGDIAVAENLYYFEQMTAKSGGFYFASKEYVVFISNDGHIRATSMGAYINHYTLSTHLGYPRFVIALQEEVLFLQDTPETGLESLSQINAQGKNLVSAVFVNADTVALAFHNEVYVYQITPSAKLICEERMNEPIAGVLTTGHANEVAVLLQSGETRKIFVE